MTILERLSLLTLLDAVALALLAACWVFLSWWIERGNASRPSVTVLMVEYRREWMRQLVTREPRIFDAAILTNLRQGTSFFASGCMIAIGGLLAMVGNTEQIQMVASDLTSEAVPSIVWQIKLLVVVLFLTHGFLKFVWANRLFGYCAVVMAAVPNDISAPTAYPRAAQAAEINIRAAWNFNRGLRAIYYSLGTLAWLLGPYALMAATAVVTFIIWQREFSSLPRTILEAGPAMPGPEETTS
ncbi:DUF599 domain-containing protein [Litoreibacter janthinus]|uniref:Uncharacterized membrane protein n=1 Tax=Litoreibacter janthinus TaxID=670154 RepID=A0A1I6G8N4_9RHOB|nr:DUF599 domain-containing protein [Litoreibacter janthinus]SFR38553.1 Uncharacterized membrane protein [Litoreibacter janthinus]